MTDILPKNPYGLSDDELSPTNFLMLKLSGERVGRHIGWQQGQDETMKALRPTLKDAGFFLGALHVIDQGENKTLGAVIDKIEQILKEIE